MTIRRLSPKTKHDYIRHVKGFAGFVGRSPDKATTEDVRRYQLRLASIGTTIPQVKRLAFAGLPGRSPEERPTCLNEFLSIQVLKYLLNQSSVCCQASLAAVSSYRGVVSLWKPWLAPL